MHPIRTDMHSAFQPLPRASAYAALGLCMAILVTGCAPSQALTEPDTALPAHYPAGDFAATASTDTGLPAWQAMVQDRTLQQLLEQASTHNHDLRLALLRAQEARAAYGIQRADRLPSIGLGSSHARARVPGDLNASRQSVVGSDHEVFVGFNSWELDLWGRVRQLSQAALQQYLASEVGAQAARQALLAQVARTYLALREADDRLALTRSTVQSRAETLRIFTRRHEVGATSKYALTQVQSLHHQALAIAVQLEQERAQLAHTLHLLTGADVAQLPPLERDAQIFAPVPVGLPSSLLTARPDIIAAEHQLQASRAQVGAARAAFFPRIALTGSWGSGSAELSGLFESGSQAWTFMPSIALPIFDGGRRQANLDVAAVRQNAAVVAYERTIQTAFREVADALAMRQGMAEQVDIQQSNLQSLQERARLAQLRYDNGASPYLDVLDAQRELLSAAQQLVQARYALQSAHVSLYTALGGGTSLGTAAPAASATTPTPHS